jgi:hypothetical protein
MCAALSASYDVRVHSGPLREFALRKLELLTAPLDFGANAAQ